MRKNLKPGSVLFPQPVYLLATYDDNGEVDVMTMAWGGMCAMDLVSLNIGEGHRTTKNIKARRCFTIALADRKYLKEQDYFGTVSGNVVPDKFARTGLKAEKSRFVDAPVLSDFPVTADCVVEEIGKAGAEAHIMARIDNVSADESVLGANGKIDAAKLNAYCFDMSDNRYFEVGKEIGPAFAHGEDTFPAK